MKKLLSIGVLCALLVSLVMVFSGCGDKTPSDSETELCFTLEVVHLDGTEKSFEVKTYKTILADALTEKGYISGYQSQYGLTIETVDGETLDWDTSGAYWAIYVNGEYSMVGASSIEIEDGATYKFIASKA